MTTVVRVADGRRVPDPRGGWLDPARPYSVNERNPAWAAYLRMGDVVAVPAQAAAAPTTTASPAAASVASATATAAAVVPSAGSKASAGDASASTSSTKAS